MLVFIPLIRVTTLAMAMVMVLMPTVPLPILAPLTLILDLAGAVLPSPTDGVGVLNQLEDIILYEKYPVSKCS